VLRRSVTRLKPFEGDHALVYQTSPTFKRLLPVMRSLNQLFYVYGFGAEPPQGRVVFKAWSEEGFLDDLASCRYVITNGGHNVISESLYLGKPVLSFPISNAYEQFINSYFVYRLGYGSYCTASAPSADVPVSFEDRLERYRERIREGMFFGNDMLARRLEELIDLGADLSNEK
jgi:uncharacterized protein (TIGR00661 family)